MGTSAACVLGALPAAADDLPITLVGRGIRIALDGANWLIDPDLFGPRAVVTYQWFDEQGRSHSNVPEGNNLVAPIAHRIQLTNAQYPGFSIGADFDATLYQRANHWYLRIRFAEASGEELEIPFAGWCDPDETKRQKYRASYNRKPIIVGNLNNKENRIEADRYPVQFEVDAHFNVLLSHEPRRGSFSLTWKQFRLNSTGMSVSLYMPPEEGHTNAGNNERDIRKADTGAPFLADTTKRYTILIFNDVRFREGDVVLGAVGGNLVAKLAFDTCEARLLGFRRKGTRPSIDDAQLSLTGEGALVCTGRGTGVTGSRIQLERWCVDVPINGLSYEAHFRGWLSRQAAAIESAHASVVIQGEGYSFERCDFDLWFGPSPPPRIECRPRLLAAHVPVLGASTADLSFPTPVIRIVLGEEERGNAAPIECQPNTLFLIGQGRDRFQTRLDESELRVKRSADLFDLTFAFRRYSLQVDDGISRLFRWDTDHSTPRRGEDCSGVAPDGAADREKPLLIVKFQPQYLFEQAFEIPTATPSSTGRVPINKIGPPFLAQTRISGGSRIVFSDTSQFPVGGERLSVQYLTDWSHLATVVNKRALPRTASLEQQLNIVEIDPNTTRAQAKDNIVKNTSAPGLEETALEPIYRLILSPDDTARWKTSRATPDPSAPVMWSATLDSTANTAVRAVWSRDMDLSIFNTTCNLAMTGGELKNNPQFVGSLNRDDRRQLVEMMSVYGIAALRRVIVDGSGRLTDDPNGMVFLPTVEYAALYPLALPSVDPTVRALQEGFVLGRPFDSTFALKLSRAATISAKWIGEPPAPWHPDLHQQIPKGDQYPLFFNPAFTIEKYIHDTQDGRDAYVEVTYKGFLFPIGHRAALLKVTRREFWPDRNREDGSPVAYLIQHQYIAVRKPDKAFPAYAQPYGSLDFPPHTVTIKTVRTPDLADPFQIAELNKKAVGTVFWPQLLQPPDQPPKKFNDVLFEYALENGATVRSPLLFVDNAAVHDPGTMQNVVQYYTGLQAANLLGTAPTPDQEPYLSFANLGAAPVRYADERTAGECTFKTAAWVLGARGWLNAIPDAGVSVTNAEDDGRGAIRLTLSATKYGSTDLTTQSSITVYGIEGTNEANGTFAFQPVKDVDPPQIILTGPKFQNKYQSGGYVSGFPVIAVTGAVASPNDTDPTGKSPGKLIRLTLITKKSGLTDLTNQSVVTVYGVRGTIEANGTWKFNFVQDSPPQIDLIASTFANAYVTGGVVSATSIESQAFSMDAFMEGRDQPPFYPIVTKARITVDKVDHLTGKPNTAIEVAFDDNFVRHGFDPTTNPGEIFLDVLGPDIQFDPTANTSSSGGVATTNSLLVALARKSGLIGGTGHSPEKKIDYKGRVDFLKDSSSQIPPPVQETCKDPLSQSPSDAAVPGAGAIGAVPSATPTAAVPMAVAPTAAAPASAGVAPPPGSGTTRTSVPAATQPSPPLQPTQTPYNLDSALAGRFDPIEFFGGALKDAKLLGIVPLKDILRAVLIAAAPQLAQATEYATSAASDAIAPFLAAAQKAVKGISGIAESVRTTANAKLPANVTLDVLYPDLAAALDQLIIAAPPAQPTNAASKINGLQTLPDLNTLFGLVGHFKADVDALIKQLVRLAQDPMPTVVANAIKTLTDAWTQLRNFASNPKAWADQLASTLLDQACDQIFRVLIPDSSSNDNTTQGQIFELVFGHLDDSATGDVKFPDIAPHAPPTPLQLQSLFKQVVANPNDVLPRLQQAVFYEVFSQPFAQALASVQQLKQQMDGNVNWARTALANQITTALRLGRSAAQNSGFPKYGWAILADLQAGVGPIIVGQPLDQIGPKLRQLAHASLQSHMAEFRADLKNWQKEADDKSKNANQAAKDAAAKVKDAASENDYVQKTAAAAAATLSADAMDALVILYDATPPGKKVDLNDLAQTIATTVQQQMQSAANDLLAQVKAQAQAAADGLAMRLFDVVSNVIDTVIHSAIASTIADIGQDVKKYCEAAAGSTQADIDKVVQDTAPAYKLIQTLGVGLVDTSDNIAKLCDNVTSQLDVITSQLQVWQIPAGAPQDALSVITGLRAGLTRSLQQLSNVLLEFEKTRLQLPEPGSNEAKTTIATLCTGSGRNPFALLDLVGRCVGLRRRAAQAVADTLNQIKTASAAWKTLTTGAISPPAPAPAGSPTTPPSSTPDLTKSLDDLNSTLGQIATAATIVHGLIDAGLNPTTANWAVIDKQITGLLDTSSGLKPGVARDDVQSTFDGLKALINKYKSSPPSPEDILQLTTLYDRKLVGMLLQAAKPFDALWLGFLQPLANACAKIIDSVLVPVHDAVDGALQNLMPIIDPSPDPVGAAMHNVVSQSTVAAIKKAQGQVATDEQNLKALSKTLRAAALDAGAIADQATTLSGSWRQNKPGIVQTVQVVKSVIDAVATGHFANLIDVNAIKAQLISAVEDLVPARIRLNYDFDTALSDFPSGDPIFAMDPGYSSDGPAQNGEVVRNDLDLRAQISVNLLTGARDVSALGFIRPFRLHLLGSSMDLATIHFKGARFQASAGSSPTFTADIAGYEIGSLLSFLQVIQNYLSPGGGNGFYYALDPLPLQIEVGYRFSKSYFTCGALIFQNIGFEVGAVLPMDGRQAEFHFSLASRARPFLISAPPPTPYGGGGFIGLRANARGVIAFEIQLEFGAIFGVQFGPLYATARITAGIYLLSGGGYRVLEGFVQAVGEGNIACFSVAVLIQIKTTQQGDSSMQGSSTYSFSFKISSFFELHYSVTASSSTKGSSGGGRGGSGGSGSSEIDNSQGIAERVLLSRAPRLFASAEPIAPKQPRKKPSVKAGNIRTVGPVMQCNWGEYQKYFDI